MFNTERHPIDDKNTNHNINNKHKCSTYFTYRVFDYKSYVSPRKFLQVFYIYILHAYLKNLIQRDVKD